jgi:hypothetical protein
LEQTVLVNPTLFLFIPAKRLIIIVEGGSEKEFVTQILRPYFYTKQISDISVFQIKHSRGGLSKYNLKNVRDLGSG